MRESKKIARASRSKVRREGRGEDTDSLRVWVMIERGSLSFRAGVDGTGAYRIDPFASRMPMPAHLAQADIRVRLKVVEQRLAGWMQLIERHAATTPRRGSEQCAQYGKTAEATSSLVSARSWSPDERLSRHSAETLMKPQLTRKRSISPSLGFLLHSLLLSNDSALSSRSEPSSACEYIAEGMTATLLTSGYGGKIYSLAFDPSNKAPALVITSTTEGGAAPTWFTLAERHAVLYAGCEFAEPDGEVRVFRYDRKSGHLSPLNTGKVGQGPVHIALTSDGRRLFTANYTSGSLSELAVREDGTIDESVEAKTRRYKGSGPYTARQEAPHVHGV